MQIKRNNQQINKDKDNKQINKDEVGWVLWHFNLCRLFNAKSIFMKIVLFQTIQFSISKQFNCEKHFFFKLFG